MRGAVRLPLSRGAVRDRGLDLPEPEPAGDLTAHWRALVDRHLPEAAPHRPDWPVRLNHCFARTLLDNACHGPWRESVAAGDFSGIPA